MAARVFYYSLQFSDKATAALLTPSDFSLHILTLNIKSPNVITVDAAAKKGG